jgi:chromosome segregation ATPase
MPGKIKVIAIIIVVLGLLAEVIYANLKLQNVMIAGRSLDTMLQGIQARASQANASLRDKTLHLKELSDVQAIRSALTSAQATVQQLSSELEQVRQEKADLQSANMNLSSRLQNTTKELIQALEEQKQVKGRIAAIGTTQPAAKSIEELSKSGKANEEAIAKIKSDSARLAASRQNLAEATQVLENKVRELEAEKSDLEKKLLAFQRDIGRQNPALQSLQGTINKLQADLSQKETQVKSLEEQLQKAGASRPSQNQQQMISDLQAANKNLNGEINRLRAMQDGGAEIGALYESAKEQLRKLSDILVRKELELDNAKRQAADAELKVADLQSRVTDLEKKLAGTPSSDAKIKELEDQRLNLQLGLNEAKDTLAKKSALADGLQKNFDTLQAEVAAKEKERRAAEDKLSELQSMSSAMQDELTRNKSRTEQKDAIYSSIKSQITQLSDVLAQKESELNDKRQEMSSLKDEIGTLKARSSRLEEEFNETKGRQRKTLDDLTQAIKLNAALQERIIGVSQTLEPPATTAPSLPPDGQKASELKRKIEVILEPQNN